jgi:hypothetical protein
MDLVEKEDLVNRFGSFLEQSPENVITMDNAPVLDLGEIPSSYNARVAESG